MKFANNIDKDILAAVQEGTHGLITNNMIKCSKSVVPNALHFVNEGKAVEFCLGSMYSPSDIVTHCWIEVNDQVIQTRVPDPNIELFKKYHITLAPNDLEAAKHDIKELIDFINM